MKLLQREKEWWVYLVDGCMMGEMADLGEGYQYGVCSKFILGTIVQYRV
jgi:hypothetical protein